MEAYKLTDLCVKRVLIALKWKDKQADGKKFFESKSLEEVTEQYNKIFPPGILGKIIGIRQSEAKVKTILDFLIGKEMVEKELLSFTDRYLKTPKVHYRPINQEKARDTHKKH